MLTIWVYPCAEETYIYAIAVISLEKIRIAVSKGGEIFSCVYYCFQDFVISNVSV